MAAFDKSENVYVFEKIQRETAGVLGKGRGD